jgi:hypothetical protein
MAWFAPIPLRPLAPAASRRGPRRVGRPVAEQNPRDIPNAEAYRRSYRGFRRRGKSHSEAQAGARALMLRRDAHWYYAHRDSLTAWSERERSKFH